MIPDKTLRPLIVGIDPGSTAAISAIDLDGNIRFIESSRNFPPYKMIEEIISHGKPIIVTSDKAKMPSKVEKVAKSVGAKKYVPDKDLGTDEKQELGQGKNSHEVDATASARNAYNNLEKQIRKIKEESEQKDEEEIKIAKKFFQQEVKTENHRNTERDSGKSGKVDKTEQKDKSSSKKVKRLEKALNNLKEENKDLKDKIKSLKDEKESLKSKIHKIKNKDRKEVIKEREIKKRESIIKEKNNSISQLEEEIKRAEIRELQYKKALEKIEKGGDLIRILREVPEEIPEKAVVTSDQIYSKLKQKGCKVFKEDEIEGVTLGNYVVIEQYPEQNWEKIIRNYKESREQECQ